MWVDKLFLCCLPFDHSMGRRMSPRNNTILPRGVAKIKIEEEEKVLLREMVEMSRILDFQSFVRSIQRFVRSLTPILH